MHPRRTRRAAALAAATTALLVAAAWPASAHVTIGSPDAAPGGFGKVVVRVPSESDTARTTQVSIDLPKDTPFAFVSSRPVPGWTVSTTERSFDQPVKVGGFTLTKAVGTVTWTAQPGQGLAPQEFQEFELSVGPFPEKAQDLTLPTTQTYSDGEVVDWDQPTPASGQEPEHPAPVLQLTAASTGDGHGSSHGEGAATAGDDDSLARWLGGGGLVLGAAALVVAATRRRRVPAERAA
jgi:uncharacterized protein YcnI